MEYITRQKIYDGRYWKEECFGLTVADVLEKAVSLQCIGNLPAKFLPLALKLLQLHPDTEMVQDAFCGQEDFKYARALGVFYVRLTARPVDIYETLEPLYRDRRKLRVWSSVDQLWSIMHMDEWIHELLTEPRVVGMALPRLPLRRVLQQAAYLPDGPRPTALKDVLLEYGGVLQYLEYKVEVEKSPAAIALWEKRNGNTSVAATATALERVKESHEPPKAMNPFEEEGHVQAEVQVQVQDAPVAQAKERRPKKKQRNYDNLFKKKSSSQTIQAPSPAVSSEPVQGSDEYWNEQRAKLGMKPLQN
jgi:pre-mRNA-splicing factor 38A